MHANLMTSKPRTSQPVKSPSTADGNPSQSLAPTSATSSRVALSKEKSLTSSVLDDNDTITVEATNVSSGAPCRITYGGLKTFGTGSFGVVYVATLFLDDSTTQEVAIKKVLQDERYKNRELQILKEMRHINVVALYYYFHSHSSSPTKANETYLNLVQEFVPQTLSRLIKHYYRIRQVIPLAFVKLYSFQLLRGLAYIHSQNVCHRDIKPQNLLINPEQGTLKICDFGSAKILDPSEPNVSYICSRYYRAPELIFGATHYTVLIDMWSAGCVIGELLLGRPLFPGGTGVDQLVEIIKVLGTPTPEQVLRMNPNYNEFKFPHVDGCPWEKVIRHRTNDSAFSVLRRLLVYDPHERATASAILSDAFFADLIFPPPGHPPNATGRLPNGKPAPQFPMEFTEDELNYLPPELVNRIRACQRAVVRAEQVSNSGSVSPTSHKPTTVRMRFSDTLRSRRPVSSSGFLAVATSSARSTKALVAASAADVRHMSARQSRDDDQLIDPEPAVKRLNGTTTTTTNRSTSQVQLNNNTMDVGARRSLARNGKSLTSRHSLYSQSAVKK